MYLCEDVFNFDFEQNCICICLTPFTFVKIVFLFELNCGLQMLNRHQHILITDLSFVFDGQILFDDVFPTLQKQTQVMRVGSELKLQVGILPILLKKYRIDITFFYYLFQSFKTDRSFKSLFNHSFIEVLNPNKIYFNVFRFCFYVHVDQHTWD